MAARPLLVLAGIGPAQAALSETVIAAWSDDCNVVWLDRHTEGNRVNVLRDTCEQLRATCAIAVGMDAVHAVRDASLALPIEGVVLHHELDFRFSNEYRQQRLLKAFAACERLWFDSTVAMDKACAHGSDRPHLLLPLSLVPRLRAETPAVASVAIVTPQDPLTESQERLVSCLQRAVVDVGATSTVHRVDHLYTIDDLKSGRDWSDTFRHRLTTRHAVLIGKSGHHAFVASGLLTASAGVFVEATIENVAVARRLTFDEHRVARGAALIERVIAAVQGSPKPSELPKDSISAAEFRGRIEAATKRKLPDWHEESIVEFGQQEFDVFFSTAAIENRSDGARPQRIRAMAQAFEDQDVPLVRITANLNLLRRRINAARELAGSGTRPRWGYGENSTAPMLPEALDTLTMGLRTLRAKGLRFAWFVRDLHWLDPMSTVSQLGATLQGLRERGLSELNRMRGVADIMYAPSRQTAEYFDRLLERSQSGTSIAWHILPPGIDSANTLQGTRLKAIAGSEVNIVYTGGLGGVYDIGMMMRALTDWATPWHLEITTRREDESAARKLAENLSSEQITIRVGEFSADFPPTEPVVGTALLDSNYGFASFPLKVMNYLEQRIPVLVYKKSPPSGLVSRYSAGILIEHTPRAIRHGLEDIASTPPRAAWDDLHRCETWNARAIQVRRDLGSHYSNEILNRVHNRQRG